MESNHLIKASLPNQQRTTVKFSAGMTVRDALIKSLSKRVLEPDMCQVYRLSQIGQKKTPIDWDVDVAMLKGDDIVVETKDKFPMHPQISHNFAKSYLTLSKCQLCNEFLMTGIKCLTCGIEFHSHCSNRVPALCKPNITQDDYCRYLMAPWVPNQVTQNREWLEQKWEIDRREINVGERIGHGSFATVYKGDWHGPVALKKLNVENPTQKQLQNFRNEMVLLKKIRHPNVLLFIGYVLEPQLIIVTQWCKGRSLYKHLHIEEKRDFTDAEIKKISMGIAQGMDYLHFKGIIHRDLKSNNVFIHDEIDLTVKIGDFGLATFKTHFEGDQQIYHPTGSILWMAPEVIRCERGSNPFTFQSDVYSYGIVLYELLSRKLPYFDFKHKDALLYLIGLCDPVRSPKLNLNVIGKDKPDELVKIMLHCTERKAQDRPLFKQILEELKNIKVITIPRWNSEPLRLNNLNGGIPLDLMNY